MIKGAFDTGGSVSWMIEQAILPRLGVLWIIEECPPPGGEFVRMIGEMLPRGAVDVCLRDMSSAVVQLTVKVRIFTPRKTLESGWLSLRCE